MTPHSLRSRRPFHACLGNAWYALLQHPEQWRLLHEHPELTEQAVEELLRYAGLTRLIAREATEDLDIHGSVIRKGQRIILRIVAGNRDPQRFPIRTLST